ncbi:MCP four helix bundle domain-containing protein [Nitrospira moscoviensis]|uniref:Chemotaxis methyl-accepting receptor HlyB-like 4HB MCP domain-containing protein n=1 Tax=Nitrospira moscoviensis TaxID=42253 RepID=A0A0K2GHI9_NITMO|nr:MCP four helix bundle domain-containing protein [Nitrospira moscoviensis]ALA60410.1 hypothetical protein NITMOv2_4026 [Nitrospira moscoviensis]
MPLWMPRVTQIIVSLLIIASGVWGGEALTKVDQDLRIIYTEYTLAATDLGHMNARLIRYRTTILRAIEADSRQQFENIASSFPAQRERIEATIDRYIKASRKASSHHKVQEQERAALIDVREKLDQYINASHRTLEILRARWKTSSPAEIRRLRDDAEQHAAQQAGPKLIAVSFALDRLLEIVAEIAGEARNEAESLLRMATSVVTGVSILLVVMVLFFPAGRRPSRS